MLIICRALFLYIIIITITLAVIETKPQILGFEHNRRLFLTLSSLGEERGAGQQEGHLGPEGLRLKDLAFFIISMWPSGQSSSQYAEEEGEGSGSYESLEGISIPCARISLARCVTSSLAAKYLCVSFCHATRVPPFPREETNILCNHCFQGKFRILG